MTEAPGNTNVHWLGAGLSSGPGIRRLAQGPAKLWLWNRTVEKAGKVIEGLSAEVKLQQFDMDALAAAVTPGDIVVSMLPGSFHPVIARLCLEHGCHFVSSSYISPEMAELDEEARKKQLCLVNEVGLDPGIDHLMAHLLVAAYRASSAYADDNELYFRSYCGGFPAVANDFRYKFSWSPVGVLRALKSPSRSIRDGRELNVSRPWQAISSYRATLPGHRSEDFEAYPNRDALPFMAAYGFENNWQVKEFVRGTLRLDGWTEAWKDIFAELDSLEGENGEERLQQIGEELWQKHGYEAGEADRVVLCVELEARQGKQPTWHRGYSMDATGNERGNAMARLVSLTVSLAVDALASGQIAAGVTDAPSNTALVESWFSTLTELGEVIEHVDYISQ